MTKTRHFPGNLKISYSEIFGHSSFLLLGISFAMQDVLDLRFCAILAGASMCVFNYYHPYGKILWLPFRWNLVFVIINGVYVAYILQERWASEHVSERELELYDTVFSNTGLSKVNFHKLIRIGSWEEFDRGHHITKEGTPNMNVVLLVKGTADVTVKDKKVYMLKNGNFIGEMGLHAGIHIVNPPTSSATVTCNEPVTCFVWRRGRLIDLLEETPELASGVQFAISNDMLRKLHRPKDHLKQHPMKKQSEKNKINQPTEDGDEQLERKAAIQLDWYGKILASLLERGSISEHDRNIMARFRRIHHITMEQHVDVLAKLHWSQSEFAKGKLKTVEQAQAAKKKRAEVASLETVRSFDSY